VSGVGAGSERSSFSFIIQVICVFSKALQVRANSVLGGKSTRLKEEEGDDENIGHRNDNASYFSFFASNVFLVWLCYEDTPSIVSAGYIVQVPDTAGGLGFLFLPILIEFCIGLDLGLGLDLGMCTVS